MVREQVDVLAEIIEILGDTQIEKPAKESGVKIEDGTEFAYIQAKMIVPEIFRDDR